MVPTKLAQLTTSPALPEPTATGDIAAEAFARFDRAMPPDEVVTELVLSVDTVEYLWRTWARLRGVVPLSPEAGRTLREALHSNRPIANGTDAVAAARRFLERPLKPCPRCKDGAREYCSTCTSNEARRAARSILRGSAKTPPLPSSRSGKRRGVEATATREEGASLDAIDVDEQSELAERAYPEPDRRLPEEAMAFR